MFIRNAEMVYTDLDAAVAEIKRLEKELMLARGRVIAASIAGLVEASYGPENIEDKMAVLRSYIGYLTEEEMSCFLNWYVVCNLPAVLIEGLDLEKKASLATEKLSEYLNEMAYECLRAEFSEQKMLLIMREKNKLMLTSEMLDKYDLQNISVMMGVY
jgi:hypothetical protein